MIVNMPSDEELAAANKQLVEFEQAPEAEEAL
jgi:hypothetical protein